MKYAFMSFSTPLQSLGEILTIARRYGFTGIEPRIDANHAHGIEVTAPPARRAAIRKQAADEGIELACLATSLKYANPAETQDTLRKTRERIDLAADLGIPVMRVFGGMLPQGLDRDAAIAVVRESLGACADYARSHNVTICMETHDDWCDPSHVAAVMKAVNHPAVAVNWDIMHPVRTKKASIDKSFDTLKPWIRHLHVHDGIGEKVTLVPIGTGECDHRRAIERLLAVGYTGYLSGEWINWEPYETHLPRELATLKGYEQEIRRRQAR